MAASKKLYTGDGVKTQFSVTFPFLSASHVFVYVNGTLQLNPMNYTLSGSTVTFSEAPGSGDAIEIKRSTSPTAPLVDFVDGSVLNEQDLDNAYLHNFYLSQEYADSFNELINEALLNVATGAGIVETETSEVIAALVNEMLNDSAASELQQRVDDIDANAEAIVQLGSDLQVQVNTLAEGTAAIVYVQDDEPIPGQGGVPDPIPDGARWYDSDDDNHPYIYDQNLSQWVSIVDPRIGQAVADISVLQVDVGDNAAAIVTEQTARANADSAIASELSLLGAQNGSQTAFILETSTVKIDSDTGDTFATRLSSLQSQIDGNNSAITTEQTARSDADNALASDITALESSVDLRARTFYQASEPTADNVGDLWFDSDDDSLWRWDGTAWQPIQDAAISGNASAISVLDGRVTTNEGDISSQASLITTLQADVTTVEGDLDTAEVNISANASAIATADGQISNLEARYGVSLNVNGYITGFLQNNDGTSGNFVILADRFAVVDPTGDPGEAEYVPFEIVNGKINLRGDVQIDGALLLNGTLNGSAIIANTIGTTEIGPNAITTTQLNADSVTANEIATNAVTAQAINVTDLAAISADLGAITAGTITLDTSGHIKSGADSYADSSNPGFWLGIDDSVAKFSIGNFSTGNYMSWDGTTMTVKGDLFVGEYVASDALLMSANTERLNGTTSWSEEKKFVIDRSGEIRLKFDRRFDGTTPPFSPDCKFRVRVNGSTVVGPIAVQDNTYSQVSFDISSINADDELTIDIIGGADDGGPTAMYIRNVRVYGDVIIPADGGTVVTN